MGAPCERCNAKPSGISGHDDLYTKSFVAGSNVVMECRACGALWHRRAAKDGSFSWAETEGAHGSTVPVAHRS
jgi:hypothetical protein